MQVLRHDTPARLHYVWPFVNILCQWDHLPSASVHLQDCPVQQRIPAETWLERQWKEIRTIQCRRKGCQHTAAVQIVSCMNVSRLATGIVSMCTSGEKMRWNPNITKILLSFISYFPFKTYVFNCYINCNEKVPSTWLFLVSDLPSYGILRRKVRS